MWPRRGEWKAEAPLFVTVRKDDPGKIVWVEEDDGERDVTRRRTLGLLLIAAAAVGGLLLAFGLRACGIEFPL